LRQLAPWHSVVGVNGAHRNANQMAKELCHGTSPQVTLHIQSGWLAHGARLCIEDLRVGYGELPRDILVDVNIEIEPCSKVGIIGPTGCGKSTLLLCLLRMLEPRGGQIIVNNVNVQTLGLATLRAAVSLVPQDPVLMQCSVRENIDPFGNFDDNIIWEGLRMVQMEQAVEALRGGLNFHVDDEAGNLSLGQRQLLHLARVIIRQPGLILLDEATSAIDSNAQKLVQNTIQCSVPNSTVVVIAHRLETIFNFDMVVVMEKGRIVEQGKVNTLMKASGGVFASMLATKKTWG